MPNSPFFAHTFLWCGENRVGNLDFLSDPATLNQARVVNNPCFVVVPRLFFFFGLISFFSRVFGRDCKHDWRPLRSLQTPTLCGASFCASRPTARGLRRRRIDFYSKACNDFDAGTLFRGSLQCRSRDTRQRSRPKCKNVTNGADHSAVSPKNTI